MDLSSLLFHGLTIGPGMLFGTLLGRWSRLRRFSTRRLLWVTGAVAGSLGCGALVALAFDAQLFGLGIVAAVWAAYAMLYLWIARQPPRVTVPPQGGVGPASRAFERRPPPDPSV